MTNRHHIHKNNPMARPLRIVYEGAACHIISRGNRAEYIFLEDKEYFIETIKKAADKYNAELYAYNERKKGSILYY